MKGREKAVLIAAFLFTLVPMIGAQTFDFVTCGQNGRYGPSQSDCNPYYSGNNNVNVVGSGIQEWTVPQTGIYEIKAYGPSGLNQNPSEAGEGAIIRGKFELDAGETLRILPGQQSAYSGSRDWFGGSGGTFVADSGNTPLIVAGGGAGHRTDSYYSKMRANTATWANDGCYDGRGGRNGDGGYLTNPNEYGGAYFAGGGAGFSGNGDASPDDRFDHTTQSESFLNGGVGGYHMGGDTVNSGGFGGGGGAGWGDAGGAGGYSGGGPNEQAYWSGCGGGGGSFIHSSTSNAATSDGSFRTTGNEPHSTYSGPVADLNNWHMGSGRVEITMITNPDDPVIQNVNIDTSAGDPATIDGSFDVDVDHDGGNAPNNELESCSITAEGADSGGQVTKNGNINGDSCSFSFDSDEHGNWNPDEELRITMNVEDSYGGTDQLTQFQQFPVNPPNSPDSPQPTDEENTVSTSHDLSVTATHPDGLEMDVRFFLDDGDGYSQVGPIRTADDGDTVSVSPALDSGTPYTWKASATTQGRTEESDEWTFTTNYRPSVGSMNVEDLDSGHAVSFSSVVSDQDGRNQIDGCELAVSDGEGDTANPEVSMSAGDSPKEAVCSVDRIDFQDSDWSHLEDLDFDLTVTDDLGLSDSDTTDGDLPNHRPAIQALRTEDYPDRQAFKITSLIGAVDHNVDEIRSCTLVIDDGENSYSAGNMIELNSTHVRCVQENVGSGQFSTLTVDEEIDIILRATDVHGSTSTDEIAFNVPTGIDYRYSSLIISAGGVDFLPFQVSNNQDVDTEYRVELQNINASFSSNGEMEKTFTLSGRSAESMSIRVSPNVEFTGTKTLEIVTENLATGINQTHEIPVRVIETGSISRKPVPGPGIVHVVVLLAAAIMIFSRSI